MMNVRIADLKDFEKIMKIYKYAQDYMIQSVSYTHLTLPTTPYV
mgnify:CR=1 FL=1